MADAFEINENTGGFDEYAGYVYKLGIKSLLWEHEQAPPWAHGSESSHSTTEGVVDAGTWEMWRF